MHPLVKFNLRVNKDKFTFEIGQIKTYKIHNLLKFQNSWLLN